MNGINTIITDDFLKSLEPCKDRLDNYLDHYSGKEFSILEFVELDNITWSDKFWVLWNHDFLTVTQQRLLACDFAEHVLHLFENQYPDDDRPRKAIIAARDSADAEAAASAYVAAYAAARAADAGRAADAAARDAADAAADAAYAARAARAAYAAYAAANAAYAAAYTAYAAAYTAAADAYTAADAAYDAANADAYVAAYAARAARAAYAARAADAAYTAYAAYYAANAAAADAYAAREKEQEFQVRLIVERLMKPV
jgi:hypothetical protein